MGTSARRANSTQESVPARSGCPLSSGVVALHQRPRTSRKSWGHPADAIAFIRVRHRSLDHLEVAFEEVSLSRMGLVALDAVYTEIDVAFIALSKASASLSVTRQKVAPLVRQIHLPPSQPVRRCIRTSAMT